MFRNLFLLALLCYSYLGVGSELHQAALNGDVNLIQQLIGEGHDPFLRDENGHTPLEVAVREGNAEATRFLLEIDAVDDMESLLDAIENVDVGMFNIAVLNVEDINGTDGLGNTPLHYAVFEYVNVTNEQVSKNPTIKANRENRLRDLFYICTQLFHGGADPHFRNEEGDSPLDLLGEIVENDPLSVFFNAHVV